MTIFDIIPEVGVVENLSWLTDVIKSINGKESRLSLRDNPRVTLEAEFNLVTSEKRSKFAQFIQTNLDQVIDVPVWPYLSKLTQASSSGSNRIYFDPQRVPITSGDPIVLINENTGDVQSYFSLAVQSDGTTLSENLTGDVDEGYYAILGLTALISSGAKTGVQQVTQNFQFNFQGWIDNQLVRDGSAASLTTFDSLPVLDRPPLSNRSEEFTINKEVIDFETGPRKLVSAELHPQISMSVSHIIQRVLDADEFDWWHLFLDTVKGSWKPYLVSTYMNDFNLATTLIANDTEVVVTETGFPASLLGYEAYKRIEIEYSDKSISRHTISSYVSSTNLTLTITPALPNDAKVANVTRISHLLKTRMSDNIQMIHGPLATLISFDTTTTDEG